jgi:hypothetical protein
VSDAAFRSTVTARVPSPKLSPKTVLAKKTEFTASPDISGTVEADTDEILIKSRYPFQMSKVSAAEAFHELMPS